MPQQIASLFATIGADVTGLTSGLASARGQLSGFSGQMATIGTNMSRIGMGMTAALTTPIVGAGVAMVKTAADFESATNILAIAARQSGTPLEDLRQAALAVGKDTQLIGIDAMEAADAMTTFYKTGFTTSQIMGDLDGYLEEGTNLTGMLRAAIDLTAASDLDLASASDAVAIAIKTFGLNAEDATGIADSFVGAADASVAEVSDLTQAMYVFGPTANQYGWSLQDTNTALAILSERGIRGAEAGTALRSMMTNMMRDTDDTTEALDALGISLYDQNGQMRTLPDIIGQLATAMGGLSEEQRNAYIQTLAGTYGMKAMATLVAENTDGWNEMAAAISDAASAQEIGEQRTRGMNGALETFQGAMQTLGITAGNTFLPTITDVVQGATDVADALSKLPEDKILDILKLGGGLAMLGPILLAAGQAVKLVSLIGTTGVIGGGLLGLLGGIFLIGSDSAKAYADSLWEVDEAVYALGGPDALQKWISLRQGIKMVTDVMNIPDAWSEAMNNLEVLVDKVLPVTPSEDPTKPDLAGAHRLPIVDDINDAINDFMHGIVMGIDDIGQILFPPTAGTNLESDVRDVLSEPMHGIVRAAEGASTGISRIGDESGRAADAISRIGGEQEAFEQRIAAQTFHWDTLMSYRTPRAPEELSMAESATPVAGDMAWNWSAGLPAGLEGPTQIATAAQNRAASEQITALFRSMFGDVNHPAMLPPAQPTAEELAETLADRLFARPPAIDQPRTPPAAGDMAWNWSAGLNLGLSQTPDEIAEMVEGVLPEEGSLTRSVTITARPDTAQLQRSADEVAAAWEQAIALRLERLKRNKLIETGGLLEGAAAVGMAR